MASRVPPKSSKVRVVRCAVDKAPMKIVSGLLYLASQTDTETAMALALRMRDSLQSLRAITDLDDEQHSVQVLIAQVHLAIDIMEPSMPLVVSELHLDSQQS